MLLDLHGPLTNIDIDYILSNDVFCKRYFIGVFSIDTLPQYVMKRPAILCFNFDKQSEKGSHWGILALIDDTIYYFESYGLCPLVPELVNFVNNNYSRKLCLSVRHLQSENTMVCGVYAVCFAIMFSMDKCVDRFFNAFGKSWSTKKNDIHVQCLFFDYYKIVNHSHSRPIFSKLQLDLKSNLCQSCATFKLWKFAVRPRLHPPGMNCVDMPLPLSPPSGKKK